MKTHAVLRLLPLLSVFQVCVVVSWACNPNEYWKDRACCEMCPPGQKLVLECTHESATHCEDCARGEFQDQWNTQRNCKPMSHCDSNAGFEQTSPGTAEQDAKCTCTEGRHCSSKQCETCVHDSACAPGFGVTKRADKVDDTRCEPCPPEFFSNETSLTEPCRPWTRCEEQNQVVMVPGSAVSDITCGDNPKESVHLKVLIPIVVLAVLLVVFAVCCCVRAKGPRNCWAKFRKNPEKLNDAVWHNPEKKTNQPPVEADEADETVMFTNHENPIQESHGEQEVGKDSHLPEQEDSRC